MTTRLHVRFNRTRKFGIELEFNNPDNYSLTEIINNHLEGERAVSAGYVHNRDNTEWCCKTDSSCGYEVASRVMSGYKDIKIAGKALDTLIERGATFNNNCGQHVHIEVRDMDRNALERLTAWWIKIEHFVLNAHPTHRRENGYCRPANWRIRDLGPNRSHNLSSVYDFVNGDRGALNLRNAPHNSATIEFRFGHMVESGEELKNRIRFLVWFVDTVKNLPAPSDLDWLTPKQTFQMLGLWNDSEVVEKTFSPAILSMKKWILNSYKANAPTHEMYNRDHQEVAAMIDHIDQIGSENTTEVIIPAVTAPEVAVTA